MRPTSEVGEVDERLPDQFLHAVTRLFHSDADEFVSNELRSVQIASYGRARRFLAIDFVEEHGRYDAAVDNERCTGRIATADFRNDQRC